MNEFESNDENLSVLPSQDIVDADIELDGSDTDSDDGKSVSWSRFGYHQLPTLPKMAAVNRAYKACIDFGLPEGFASALANAVVDPAELRSALNHPTKVNVAGGTIEAIDVDMYVPGLVPLPTNNRTMDNRVYPAGGASGFDPPLIGPRSLPGESSELWIEARSVEHAIAEAKRGSTYILAKNPLMDSVGERGIVMPVTVSYFELRHRDGQPSMPELGTPDGSSRIAAGHAQLGLTDPRITHYDMPTDRDLYRRFISGITSADTENLNATQKARIRRQRNALVTPARVFLRFTPQPGGSYDYARAVAAYVGMLHVDPPRPWTPTGKLEAMAESVLEVLSSAKVIGDVPHDYLAGLLTPEAAEAAGLPTWRDEEAAYVLATLLQQDLRELVDRGIMDVTAKKSVTAPRRNDVVAELALRPTRSEAIVLPAGDPKRDRAATMRAAYLRATHMPLYSSRQWEVTARTPDEILRAALDELGGSEVEQNNPTAWRNRLELAALAQYHLTAHGALRREAYGDEHGDKRGPQEILQAMLNDEQGLRLLNQAIVDGRAGNPIRLVDQEGEFIETPSDDRDAVSVGGVSVKRLTNEWLRSEGFPSGGPVARPVSITEETPLMKAARLEHQAINVIEQLGSLLDELENVKGPAGGLLLDQRGWPASDTEGAMKVLLKAQTRLGYWGIVADRQASLVDTLSPDYDDEHEDPELGDDFELDDELD